MAEDMSREGDSGATCVCPFCDQAVEASAPWCTTCGVELRFCEECEEPLPIAATVCPACGAECEE
jgi:hypothetical protein